MAKYVRDFGTRKCWELDALTPPTIIELITKHRNNIIDQEIWKEQETLEEADVKVLKDLAASMKK